MVKAYCIYQNTWEKPRESATYVGGIIVRSEMCEYISKIPIQFLQPIKYNYVSDLLPQSHLSQKGVKTIPSTFASHTQRKIHEQQGKHT